MPFERLMALLLEERDGILMWMLAGARDFVKRGLRLDPPDSILRATENYFADEDLIGRFVKDWFTVTSIPESLTEPEIARFLQQPTNGTSSGVVHEAFTAWSQFGKHPWGAQKVIRRLEKLDGVVARRGTGNRLYVNLLLNDTAKIAIDSRPAPSDEEQIPF